MSVKAITEENFEQEVLNSEKPVLLDFYADWCGPCKMMSPIIDEIAEEIGETAVVGKVNSDDNMELAEKYEIMSIPTIMIIKNGQEVKRFLGVTPKEEIIKAINE
jgi:thioredoxin 1